LQADTIQPAVNHQVVKQSNSGHPSWGTLRLYAGLTSALVLLEYEKNFIERPEDKVGGAFGDTEQGFGAG
jgi:hypothetical protein